MRVKGCEVEKANAKRPTVLKFQHGHLLIRFCEIHFKGSAAIESTEMHESQKGSKPDFFDVLLYRTIQPINFICGSGSSRCGSSGR